MVAVILGDSGIVTRVTDDAPGGTNSYASANVRAVGTCTESEIWYARNVRAGASSVTVHMNTNAPFAVWIVEATGLSTSGGADAVAKGSGEATTTILAPTTTPSGVPAFTISAAGSCGTVGRVSAPFVDLEAQQNNEVAYCVTTGSGPIGAVFDNTQDAWSASVASFR